MNWATALVIGSHTQVSSAVKSSKPCTTKPESTDRLGRVVAGGSRCARREGGRVGPPDLAVRVFHLMLGRAAFAAGWSGVRAGRWVADRGEQAGPGVFPWPALGQVRDEAAGRGRGPRRDVDELAADRAGGRP